MTLIDSASGVTRITCPRNRRGRQRSSERKLERVHLGLRRGGTTTETKMRKTKRPSGRESKQLELFSKQRRSKRGELPKRAVRAVPSRKSTAPGRNAALPTRGLPLERAAWLARGALPITIGGIGANAQEELLAQIGEFALGPLVYCRPWVVIALGDSSGLQGEGMLGVGALLPFARIGFDSGGGASRTRARQRVDARCRWTLVRAGAGRAARPRGPGRRTWAGRRGETVGEPDPARQPGREGRHRDRRALALDGQPSSSIPFDALCRRLWPPARPSRSPCAAPARRRSGW